MTLNKNQKQTAVIFGIGTLAVILMAQALFRTVAIGGSSAVASVMTILLAGVTLGVGGWLLYLQQDFGTLSFRQRRDLVSHLQKAGYDRDLSKRVVAGINWFRTQDLTWQPGTTDTDFNINGTRNCVLAKATSLSYFEAKMKYGLTGSNVCHKLAFTGDEEVTQAWQAAGKYCLEHGLA